MISNSKRNVFGGNVGKGRMKKSTGQRSGVRRSTREALVVKKKWLDLIFAGRKTWEIRGTPTNKRGQIHLAESHAGGKLVGRACLVDCFSISPKTFKKHQKHHCLSSWAMVPYQDPYAWVLKDAERYEKSLDYDHKQGAVIWVHV